MDSEVSQRVTQLVLSMLVLENLPLNRFLAVFWEFFVKVTVHSSQRIGMFGARGMFAQCYN